MGDDKDSIELGLEGMSGFSEVSIKTEKGSGSLIGITGTFPSKTAATYSPTLRAVPSARRGLTSLFGMGRGGTPAL